MRVARTFVLACVGVVLSCAAARADAPAAAIDSDHDGLSDALEQELLVRFAPKFQADPEDCAGVPAAFLPDARNPVVAAEDGTIYGQATPRALKGKADSFVELRYFHLWKSDCGRMGHPLDTEHVSVLIEKGTDDWHAIYWYAAAHEGTMCDASQIARASTLGAENAGAPVWISRGKHASFLNQELCRHGCGGDKCGSMQTLRVSRIVNLGEEQNPVNGSLWVRSVEWPLAVKLARSDFDAEALAHIERLPTSDIAWVNPSKRPAQATIAASGSAADALAMSKGKTDTAIILAGDDTGNALGSTYGKVTHSLKKSVRGVGRFVRGCTDRRKSGTPPQALASLTAGLKPHAPRAGDLP
jgi:hypothetical protein